MPGQLIPKAPLARIALDNGAKRISAHAVTALTAALTAKGLAIAKKAVQLARHAGRKTVTAEDVRVAVK